MAAEPEGRAQRDLVLVRPVDGAHHVDVSTVVRVKILLKETIDRYFVTAEAKRSAEEASRRLNIPWVP